MLNNVKENLLNIFFPPYCIGCGKTGSYICPDCARNIKNHSSLTPPSKNSPISGIISCINYNNELVKEMIGKYKYEGITALTPILAELLAKSIKKEHLCFKYIAYAPISKKRLQKRGYNQTELLASEVSSLLNIPLYPGLKKVRETKTQVGLVKRDRERNLKNAFLCVGQNLKDASILVIDDVYTTGTTISECAKALKKKGAGEIYGAVIARE